MSRVINCRICGTRGVDPTASRCLSALLQSLLLKPPQQNIQSVLAEKGFPAKRAGWHTPVPGISMGLLILFDEHFQASRFRLRCGVELCEIKTRAIRREV